ncbi:MAG: signal peptidase II [Oscillospiraceae bacterium]|nr:signal peptidase II [Oscillospiraceae bacterium]
MLVFVFSALVVLLDQFLKRWVVRTIGLLDTMELIPGVIEFRHLHNTGAAFGIFAGQRWLLVAISFVACLILIFILLRYTDGFWGTLGLAAVLGGAVGNLIDRVLYGYVIDMFNFEFVQFAVFNVADIFITLGFITFCIHFISSSVGQSRQEKEEFEYAGSDSDDEDFDTQHEEYGEYEEEYRDPYEEFELPQNEEAYDNEGHPVANTFSGVDSEPDIEEISQYVDPVYESTHDDAASSPAVASSWQEYYEPEQADKSDSTIDALSALELELGSIDNYDVDELLREYGFEDDKS